MKSDLRLAWNDKVKIIPESLNGQLVGTFPSIVRGDDGVEMCAFFVRVAKAEISKADLKKKSGKCLIKPQFVKTPHGPMIVAYCMVSSEEASEPFISETAIFPRLPSMPSHREIAELLQARGEAYFVLCNEKGGCIYNAKARVLDQWRAELAENAMNFDDGKQIADEKTAIMSLYWYQERYNPSTKIFEVKH